MNLRETPSPSLVDSKPKKPNLMEHLRRNRSVATTTIALAGALTLSACQSSSAEGPQPSISHSVEETADPTVAGVYETAAPETPAPVETEAPLPELEPIPTNLSTEELAQRMADITTDWRFEGATPETIETTLDKHWAHLNDVDLLLEIEESFLLLAQENAERYVDAYFPENWKEVPKLVEFYDYITDKNAITMRYVVAQYRENVQAGNDDGPLPYWDTELSEFIESTNVTEGTRIVTYNMLVTPQNAPEEAPGTLQVTQGFDVSGETAKFLGESKRLLP